MKLLLRKTIMFLLKTNQIKLTKKGRFLFQQGYCFYCISKDQFRVLTLKWNVFFSLTVSTLSWHKVISEIFFCMWTFVFSYFNLSLSSRIRFFSWMSSAFSLVCLYCIDVSFSVSFPCLFVLIHVSLQIVFWTVKKKSPMIDVSELLCMASLNDA